MCASAPQIPQLPNASGLGLLLFSVFTTWWQQNASFPGASPSIPFTKKNTLPSPNPLMLQPLQTPLWSSRRNLSAIQDREICCYSISCKEKDNIGAWLWEVAGTQPGVAVPKGEMLLMRYLGSSYPSTLSLCAAGS